MSVNLIFKIVEASIVLIQGFRVVVQGIGWRSAVGPGLGRRWGMVRLEVRSAAWVAQVPATLWKVPTSLAHHGSVMSHFFLLESPSLPGIHI